jgi:pSer/pThr/pTyr-binding forkhead associated (FHA) protein
MATHVRLIDKGNTAGSTREIPITQPEFLIGRGADCDLRLRLPSVSRHHCTIRVAAGEATVTDLGSSNGTFVNGQRVRSTAPVHSGDELKVGACAFLVDLGDTEGVKLDVPDVDPVAATMKLPKKE